MISKELFVAYYIAAITGLSYAMILPSLEHYVTADDSKHPPGVGSSADFFSLIVSIYSVGEVAGGFVFGHLFHLMSVKNVMLLSMPLGLLSSVLYSVAPDSTTLLIARLIAGIWTGGLSNIIRAYLGQIVPRENLTSSFANLLACSTLFMALGPGFGAGFAQIDFTIGGIRVDEYRSPGWLLAIISIVGFFAILILCENPKKDPLLPPALKEVEAKPQSNDVYSKLELDSSPAWKRALERVWAPENTPSLVLITGLLFAFAVNVGFSVIETMATPIMADYFGYDSEASSWAFLFSGVLLFFASLGLKYFVSEREKGGRFNDRKALLFSLLCLLIGALLMIDYQDMGNDPCTAYSCDVDSGECSAPNTGMAACVAANCVWNQWGTGELCKTCAPICRAPDAGLNKYQFFVGFGLMNVGFITGRTFSSTLFVKYLSEKVMGTMMAWVVAVGAVARIIAPVWGMAAYQAYDRRTYVMMASTGGAFLLCVVILMTFYKEFDPARYTMSYPDADLEKSLLSSEKRSNSSEDSLDSV